jgi:hypothetical protein
MKKYTALTIATLAIITAGCGNSSNISSSPAESVSSQQEFAWTTEALYQAMLDDQTIDSWGYKNYEGISAVDEFAKDSGNHITDVYSDIKPANCELVASLTLARAEIGGKLYSRVDHFDKSSLFSVKSFLLYTYTFENTAKAQEVFTQIKSSLAECSSFNYLKGSEVFDYKLWDQPTVNDATKVVGNDGGGVANAFGINGSAIWSLQVLNGDSVADAEAIAKKAALEVDARLTAVQNK